LTARRLAEPDHLWIAPPAGLIELKFKAFAGGKI
jgi:hypothetical protein